MLSSLMPVMFSWSDRDRTVLRTGKYKGINNNDEDATVNAGEKKMSTEMNMVIKVP